ncbi:DISARM system phospholipase D-like protein DrmC [Sorangium sp. So ce321]|uniref:DISARM system phospholipase D-like protein DrmC n=1 Tax=Sorangium sp. So ce321 TaxID=3133300 RepID=UPI003F646B96
MTAPVPLGLSRVPLPVLAQVLEAIEHGRVDCPATEADLLAGGFGALSGPIADALTGCDRVAAGAAIRLVIAERVHRPPPRLSLVWTGPEAWASVSRDTSMVVRELFAGARRSVIVGGYAFDKPEILEPLHTAMAERGVTAQIFMDIAGSAPSLHTADSFATKIIDNFLREVWTFGLPKPDMYYDPRTAMPGPPWASLHAKCIVVDEERTLITSANFTDRGQTRNIEAGVLIEDGPFAEEVSAQWRLLITAGLVRRYRG